MNVVLLVISEKNYILYIKVKESLNIFVISFILYTFYRNYIFTRLVFIKEPSLSLCKDLQNQQYTEVFKFG